jgi:hypothetical protein
MQLDQLQLRLASSRSPVSGTRILHNRLWRFPSKPPALLGVIGFQPENGFSGIAREDVTGDHHG